MSQPSAQKAKQGFRSRFNYLEKFIARETEPAVHVEQSADVFVISVGNFLFNVVGIS
jgi:hypothetical protein